MCCKAQQLGEHVSQKLQVDRRCAAGLTYRELLVELVGEQGVGQLSEVKLTQ